MKLYDFQHTGVDFLAARARAYLADDMGLGKTAQACVATGLAGMVRRVLVVCPASAKENWRREWKTWGPLGRTFCVISWSSSQLQSEQFMLGWDIMILDEAHYAKTPGAKRTRAALLAAAQTPIVWCLSGTPNPNKHLGELYTVFRALMPEACAALGLRTYDEWFNHFCEWSHVGPFHARRKRVYGVKNTDDIRPYLRKFMLRRRLSDVELQLPELRVDVHRLPRDPGFLVGADVPPELGAAYERMAAEEGSDKSTARLRRYLGEYKAPRIARVIAEELEAQQYEKIVIMAHHRSVLKTFGERLQKFGVIGFDGGTPSPKRQGIIDEFKSNPRKKVFVVQQQAGGVAIDGLQVSSEIVLAEPDFTPDPIRQQIKRIHRIGSTRPCRARVFAVADTLDEGVLGTVTMKLRHEQEIGL